MRSIASRMTAPVLTRITNTIDVRNFGRAVETNMRFVQYKLKSGEGQQLGAQKTQSGDIFPVSESDGSVPNSLVQFLEAGSSVYDKAIRLIEECKGAIPLSEVHLLSPITKNDKVACVGLNYSGHCEEQNIPQPKEPMIFSKFSSVIAGPYDDVVIPPITDSVDWEVELAVVIGKTAKNVDETRAQDYVFGYTVAQDISARDWQKRRNNGQFLLGKSMDTFCPLGPAVVTKSEVDPNNLPIKCWVNGELKQDGNTSELIFKIDFLIAYLSRIVTLYPGDVILTGTPAGVGMHRKPPQFLKPGDVLESEIEGIGRLKNRIA
ncbi:fumarylacetoacetate hydrolase domain-containing protein 2A [Cylas formicarius]|uniref:fumarylacetoacetate hydrolase domain-containing protein 2A n=1 Tax=Cylas formicarius TaxID=197179 RepID=UPI0029586BBA|nr:fumarylacetoacetate hydrolase domain-containing protein 2A [Cylas formicarius]